MAITANVLTTVGNFADGGTLPGNETPATSFATASVSPTANRLVLLAVASGDTAGATTVPTASGAGLTFTLVDSQQQGVGNQRITVLRAMSASPGTGAITIDFAGVTQENCGWLVVEFGGVVTSGTNGADAIEQIKKGTPNGSNVSVTLDNAVTSGNATFGAYTGNTESPVYTAGAGFVLLGNGWSCDGPSNKGHVEWDADGVNPVAFSNAGTPLGAMVALEIAANTAEEAMALITGVGTLSAEAVVADEAEAALTGTGTLAAEAISGVLVEANLSGTGSLSAVGIPSADAMPTLAVEIEFDPITRPGVWTDVSDYFVSASTNRGRSQELEQYQAGTATVTLRNEDRRFDPSYVNSPYSLVWEDVVDDLAPVHWFRMDEASGSITDSVGSAVGRVSSGSLTYGADSLLPRSTNDAIRFGSASEIVRFDNTSGATANPIPSYPHSVSFWFKYTFDETSALMGDGSGTGNWELNLDTNLGETNVILWVEDTNWTTVHTTDLIDGHTYFVTMVSDGFTDGTLVYLNDYGPSAPVGGTHTALEPYDQTILRINDTPNFGGGETTYDEVLVFDYALTQEQHEDLYHAGWASFVKPGRNLRITATYNDGGGDVSYPVFTGRIDSWDHEYEMPDTARVVIQATDKTKILERAKIGHSVFVNEIEADSPVAWWRLGDPATITTGLDQIGSRDLTFQENPKGGESLVTNDDNKSTFFDHAEAGSGNVAEVSTTMPFGYPFSIEMVFRSAKTTDDLSRSLLFIGNATHWIEVFIRETAIGDPGRLTFLMTDDGAATTSQTQTNIRVDDKGIHHVVITMNSISSIGFIYLDGVDVTQGSMTNTDLPSGTVALALGNVGSTYPFGGEFGLDGELQDVVLYNSTLSAGRALAHYNAMSHPWQNDAPGDRIDRVLDLIEWPAGDRDLDAGSSTLQSASINMSALEHIQKVADSDFGRVFIAKDGKLTFHGRAGISDAPTGGTFGDDIPGGELGYEAIDMDYSDQLIRNDVTISRNDGVAQHVVDQVSVDEYDAMTYTSDGLYHNSDALSAAAAAAIVVRYSQPIQRVTGLTVNPAREPADMFPATLDLELGDVVTVRRRPPGGGDPFEQACEVHGIAHDVGPKSWITTFTLAPAFDGLAP